MSQDFNVMRGWQIADSSRCRIYLPQENVECCSCSLHVHQATDTATHDISSCGFTTVYRVLVQAENLVDTYKPVANKTAWSSSSVSVSLTVPSVVTILGISVIQLVSASDDDNYVDIVVFGK